MVSGGPLDWLQCSKLIRRMWDVDMAAPLVSRLYSTIQNDFKLKGIAMRILCAAFGVLAIAGCGTVPSSSGVMQLGPDTYRVAARGPMGAVHKSQQLAFDESNRHCQSLGRLFKVIGTRQIEDVGGGPYEVTYRCLLAGDPELTRPNLEPVPDVTVKVK